MPQVVDGEVRLAGDESLSISVVEGPAGVTFNADNTAVELHPGDQLLIRSLVTEPYTPGTGPQANADGTELILPPGGHVLVRARAADVVEEPPPDPDPGGGETADAQWTVDWYQGAEPGVGTPVATTQTDVLDYVWESGAALPSGISGKPFSFRARRKLELTAGAHRISVRVDDGARVRVEGTVVLDEWRPQPATDFVTEVAIPSTGVYDVEVDYYDNGPAGRGEISADISLSETVAAAFRLVEPISDAEMGLLTEGQTVQSPFAVEVEPEAPIGSIASYIDGVRVRVDSSPPYAIFGDVNGDYAPDGLAPGAHKLEARLYSEAEAAGTLLGVSSINLTVEAEDPPDTGEPPPTGGGGALPASVTSVLNATAESFLTLPSGWQEVAYDDFSRVINQGQWGKPNTSEAYPMMTRGGRWRPTNPSYRDSSGRGRYAGVDTCWTRLVDGGPGGELVQFIRSRATNADGSTKIPFAHDPTKERIVSRPLPMWGAAASNPSMDTIKRAYSIRRDLVAKFPGSENDGYKVAYLMWGHARLDQPGYAEEDWPEFRFGDGLRGNAFHHKRDTIGGQIAWRAEIDTTAWHLYTTIYEARNYKGHPTGRVRFYIDGVLVAGSADTTEAVSDRDLYVAEQTETFLNNVPTLPPPSSGHVLWRLYRIAEKV